MQITGIMNTARQGMATETARARERPHATLRAAPAIRRWICSIWFSAEIGFRANAAVFETGADLWEVLATIKRD
jgi:hypothetical protein